MNRFNWLLMAGLLCMAAPTEAAVEMRSQTVTTGNDDWDAGTDLDVTRPVLVTLYNTGSVTVKVAWSQAAATADEEALTLAAGGRASLEFKPGEAPSEIFTYGEGAAGSLLVVAANSNVKLQQEFVSPAALADSTRTRYRTLRILHTDLSGGDTETETDGAGALPSGARLIGFELVTTTAIVGGDLSAATIDCGFNGASLGDVLCDGCNIFATGTIYGTGANAKPNAARDIGGKTLQCTLDGTDDDIGDATAGDISATLVFSIPGPG